MTRDVESPHALLQRAERALTEGRARPVVEPLLKRIVEGTEPQDEAHLVARRHLAELCLEDRDAWGAALHLRRVTQEHPGNDVVQALSALAHALLGNYRMAAAAYRRALTQAPRNPWYHHNLGHLLDVALGQPEEAVGHLEMAEKHADPPEDEITASLAHCLFRVGRQEEAERMAAKALEMAPENAEHQALLDWIGAGSSTHPAPPRRPVQIHGVLAVGDLLEEHMRRAGFGPRGIARARALWSDYLDERQPRVKKPEVCAAAVHCAMVLVDEVDGITQASVARRYGATPGSVRNRFGDIRSTLALRPGDPRYRG